MDKIITFLGADDYDQTTYYYNKQSFGPVRYFTLALAHFFPAYRIIVLATSKAQTKHGHALRDQLENHPAGFWVELVPEPVTEDALWDVFEIIQQQIQDGDRLIFDITHSFRSLPFLAFLSLAYLRVVRRLDKEAVQVLYAPLQEYEKSKVYDLSQFVELLDWTTATHLFLQTGHAAPLVQRLNHAEWSTGADAGDLERASAALRLARPDEARQQVYDWAQTLADLDPDIDLAPPARPFGLLLKRVQAEFEQITPRPPDAADLRQELEQELALIHWNVGRGQLLSAVTVAREWLVSLMCWQARWIDLAAEKGQEVRRWRSKNGRGKAEKALNALAYLAGLTPAERDKEIGQKTPPARELWQAKPEYAKSLGLAWKTISNLRNDLNHAGKVHTTTPRPLDTLLAEVEQVPRLLQALFDRSGAKTPTQL